MMNPKEKLPLVILAYYQDNLLPGDERKSVDQILSMDQESRQQLENLYQLDASLQSLGQRERVRQKVKVALKSHSLPSESVGLFTFFPSRTVTSCALFLVCILAVWFGYQNHSTIQLLQKNGQVHWVAENGIPSSTHPQIGDQISSGQNSYAMIRLADRGSVVEMGPESQIVLLNQRQIRIDQGVVCHHIAKDPSHPFQAITPFGTITVLGTVFEIEVTNQKAIVRVEDGKVQVTPKKGMQSQQNAPLLQAGYQTTLQNNTVAAPNLYPANAFAPWRASFLPSKVDTSDIAKIISNKKP